MTENNTTEVKEVSAEAASEEGEGRRGRRGAGAGRGRRPDNRDRDRDRGEDNGEVQKPVYIGRVSKTVKGGKRFSIAALVVVGDGKGKVGFGKGKAKEVQDAMRKAVDQARRNMVRVPLRDGRTIHHDVSGKYGAGIVLLRAAPPGTGIIAGGPMRAIFEAIGVKDVVAKSKGSSNPHNMVRATFDAMSKMTSPRTIAARRNKKVNEIVTTRKGEAALA
jgi:small subunit ribosomal protein S5